MSTETKEKIIRFLVRTFFGEDVNFTLTRKTWLEEIAREANKSPNSKVLVLKILRLDGTPFKEALEKYNYLNKDLRFE